MALTEAIQDYLEKLYWFEEAGIEPTQANLARAMQVSQPSVTEMVRRLVDEGLVERDERKRLHFTQKGEEVAKHVVSRHRLIEVFLVKVLGIPWDEVHEEAHTFEHAISPTIERQMQKLLAEATTCPHGHPIGDAPRETGEILASLPAGSKVRVLRLENEDPDLLRVLKAAGVEPGDTITLVSAGEDEVQLDTALGERSLTLDAAASVSVAVVERGEGPAAATPEISAAALLSGSSWGR
jgi:DtxR family transcriptional regulator, Mn-dependent transcriptional regulator